MEERLATDPLPSILSTKHNPCVACQSVRCQRPCFVNNWEDKGASGSKTSRAFDGIGQIRKAEWKGRARADCCFLFIRLLYLECICWQRNACGRCRCRLSTPQVRYGQSTRGRGCDFSLVQARRRKWLFFSFLFFLLALDAAAQFLLFRSCPLQHKIYNRAPG